MSALQATASQAKNISIFFNGAQHASGPAPLRVEFPEMRFPLTVSVDSGAPLEVVLVQADSKAKTKDTVWTAKLFTSGTVLQVRLTKRYRHQSFSFTLQVQAYEPKAYRGPDKDSAEKFLKLFEPYRGRYSIRYKVRDSLPGITVYQYATHEERLSFPLIRSGLNGKQKVGFSLTHSTRVLGIELDAHGIPKAKRSAALSLMYNQLVQRIGSMPQLVEKSPRGLHCYWFLETRAPSELITQRIKKTLEGLPCEAGTAAEVLPTNNSTLSIPVTSRFIDPKTFQSVSVDFEKVPRLTARQVFGNDLSREDLSGLASTRRSISLRKLARLEEIERPLLPIRAGSSNEAYKVLSVAYLRIFRGDVNQAAQRFLDLLTISAYQGELLNLERIEAKFRSTSKNLKNKGFSFTGSSTWQLDLEDFAFVRQLMNLGTWPRQRQAKIQAFLERLLAWFRYQDIVFQNKAELALWDFFYPFYRLRRREGVYPLPSVMLREWMGRYKDVIRWLEGLNVLSLRYQYSEDLGTCRYYALRRVIPVRENPHTQIIEALEKLRESGRTQAEIAHRLGVGQDTVSLWLSGKRVPSAQAAASLLNNLAHFCHNAQERPVGGGLDAIQGEDVTDRVSPDMAAL